VSINRDFFDELFVLELANNHWGSLERGLQIVHEFSRVVRYNNVRAAIKLQFRDVDSFIHPSALKRTDVRYIKKTLDTRLSREALAILADTIKKSNCIPMATPFDEASVALCEELNLPIIKLASSDINDWVLIERIAKARKPVIASTGGSSLKDMDDLVTFFENRGIALALNHCVSLYPTDDGDLELNQIDFLKARYPGVTIGFSTHEHTDWASSITIAYAKGARTFERHIDIDSDGRSVTPYCSLPEQVDEWFRAFKRAKAMCGSPGTQKRIPTPREIEYLEGLVRGVYAARDLPAGHRLCDDDVVMAVPLLRGQLSCRELITGEIVAEPIASGEPVMLAQMDTPYARNPSMRARVNGRGIERLEVPVRLVVNR
jgi:N-acetylneuraminate synthase